MKLMAYLWMLLSLSLVVALLSGSLDDLLQAGCGDWDPERERSSAPASWSHTRATSTSGA